MRILHQSSLQPCLNEYLLGRNDCWGMPLLGSLIPNSNRVWLLLLSQYGNHGATDDTKFVFKKSGECDSQKSQSSSGTNKQALYIGPDKNSLVT